jgi:hypothetical protein
LTGMVGSSLEAGKDNCGLQPQAKLSGPGK